jgi:hypothetical protein
MAATGARYRDRIGASPGSISSPQTILTCAYLAQIFAGLREAGLRVFHVLLDADEEILRQRIRASRSWMIPAADVVVDTGRWTLSSAAHQIADALRRL